MSREPLKIEEMLERIGTNEVPGDPEHRYDLRRSLLCSRYFDYSRKRRWDKIFSYTAPLIAGGMMVGVFAVLAVSWSPDESPILTIPTMAGPSEVAAHDPILFVSNADEPLVQLAEFDTIPPAESVRFVPITMDDLVLVQ